MTNVVSMTFKGQTVTVNADLLQGYLAETTEHYDTIEDAKSELKLIGEALEEQTKIPASVILKYAKARYDDAKKENSNKRKTTKETGEIFGAIDNALSS